MMSDMPWAGRVKSYEEKNEQDWYEVHTTDGTYWTQKEHHMNIIRDAEDANIRISGTYEEHGMFPFAWRRITSVKY